MSPEDSLPVLGDSASAASAELRERIKGRAGALGFALAGVADPRPSEHADFLRAWLDDGAHGTMEWLARPEAVARREDLRRTMASVRSVVVVAHDYHLEDPGGVPDDPSRAVVARYARGDDYHGVMEEKLGALHRWIEKETGREVEGRVYVDHGPVLERELARRAGLGWFGKNTMLLHPEKGSYLFLGVLLLDLDLPPDDPFTEDRCGSCSRCVEACPTDALLGRDDDGAPVIDASRCISYLTIEHRGPIPRELRPLMGNRVYGCDICQEVCPWNEAFAEETTEEAYRPRPELDGPTLVELAERLLPMSENEFLREYADSPIARARRKGLLRNVCIGLGNWLADVDEPPGEAADVLVRALDDDRPLVRGHAAWALGRLGGSSASTALSSRLEAEEHDWVREECTSARAETD